jgi:two-component system phosphate regulon response regulator PhoB
MSALLLLVDPDVSGATSVAARLRDAGFPTDTCTHGAEALARMESGRYDAIITEIDLPGSSGFELCRTLRMSPVTAELPVIVLTTRADEIDRVVAFEVGADDFVVKPCFPRELALRVRARLRRSPRPAAPTPLRAGNLEIDPVRQSAAVGGRPLALTATELALLAALARRAGTVVERATLLREVWEIPSGQESRTLDTHLRRLREKLGDHGPRVETLRGVGYRLRPSNDRVGDRG